MKYDILSLIKVGYQAFTCSMVDGVYWFYGRSI